MRRGRGSSGREEPGWRQLPNWEQRYLGGAMMDWVRGTNERRGLMGPGFGRGGLEGTRPNGSNEREIGGSTEEMMGGARNRRGMGEMGGMGGNWGGRPEQGRGQRNRYYE